MTCQTPIIVALDFPSRDAALALARQLDPRLCRVKVGKELFTRCGPAIVEALQAMDFEVFLDLKFHDIPNTTAMAVKAAAELGVWMVNVHCSGGLRMMAACRETLAGMAGPAPLLIGVTVLTSMEQDDLAGIGGCRAAGAGTASGRSCRPGGAGRTGVFGPGSRAAESAVPGAATGYTGYPACG